MAYDKKFREKVLKFIDSGNTTVKAKEVYGVSRTTIQEWRVIQETTGGLEKRPLKRTAPKLNPNRLRVYMAEHPDAYQREVAEAFNCTGQAVSAAFKRMKYMRKKNG